MCECLRVFASVCGYWGVGPSKQDNTVADSQKPVNTTVSFFVLGGLKRRCFMLIVSPEKVVGWGGGNQNDEGDLLTIG